jgi:hypothetical protein
MPPKRGGGVRGRRKYDTSKTVASSIDTSQQDTTEDEKLQITNVKPEFGIAPLILEDETLTKIKINDLIKKHLSSVKVLNIHVNRSKSFTLYASDVNSFNRLLNESASIIQTEENLTSSI